MNPLRGLGLALVVWLAQGGVWLGAEPAEALLLKGATLHTVASDRPELGEVLIRGGKIVSLGGSLQAPDATVVDLSGLHVYPGMIALNTVLGLTEIEAIRATEDNTEVGEYTPDVESWIAVNPDSELIPVSRANGIAYFEPVPKGGVVSGQSALLATAGWTAEQMVVRKPIALHVFWPKMDLDLTPPETARTRSRPKSLAEQGRERSRKLRDTVEFFEEARAYARAKEAKGARTAPPLVPAWEAMLPAIRGEVPIVIHAESASEIRTAVEWAATNGFKAILAGGREAARVAAVLAERKIPVIYDHVFTQPARDTDAYDAPFSAPAVLHQAGVKVIFSQGLDSFNAPLLKNLPYNATHAVAFGLPRQEALKGLTLYPAEAAGVADRLGTLAPGKDATLIAVDGDLLDIRSHVKRMWISGKEVSLEDRHTRFYEKYRNRPR